MTSLFHIQNYIVLIAAISRAYHAETDYSESRMLAGELLEPFLQELVADINSRIYLQPQQALSPLAELR
jgi:hypothetical protein